MAIIVEDGSGKKDAGSYTTEAYFRAYFLARAIDVTALDATAVEALLVAATDYIGTRWGLRFLGNRLFKTLTSRSEFTLSAQPSDGETVTIGSAVVTFKVTLSTSPAVDTEALIGSTITDTLNNLGSALFAADQDLDNDDQTISDFLIVDPDSPTLTCYVTRDGVATTEAVTNGAFDAALSSGVSGRPQPLDFPRKNLYDRDGILVDGIPVKLKDCVCEYAYRANSAALSPDPETTDSGLRTTGIFEKVGPIETKTTFAENQTAQITKPYPAADRLLQEYVRNANSVIRA